MAINYLISQQTSIITFDDINIICFLKRTTESTSEQFSVFKKISNLAALTNVNNFYNIASAVCEVEIACTLPDGASVDKADKSNLDKVFGLMYKKSTDNVPNKFYIEVMIADNIAAASAVFNDKVKSYDGVDDTSVSIFQVGSINKTEKNEAAINDKKLTIAITEQTPSNLFIKKGLDSFKEFNRKIYACVVE